MSVSPVMRARATETNGWVYVSGQPRELSLAQVRDRDPDGDLIGALPPDIELQTRATFQNLIQVLAERGLGLQDVVSARCFLTHFHEDFQRFNVVYAEYFHEDRKPARSCSPVNRLAHPGRVEIEVIARRR